MKSITKTKVNATFEGTRVTTITVLTLISIFMYVDLKGFENPN